MKKCFTLAEVLITLTILGVIAALTIPNVIQRYQERVYVAKLKKIHTTLNNAFEQAVIFNGPPTSWDIGTAYTPVGSKKVYDIFSPFLAISKYCGTSTSDCMASEYKVLYGDTKTWFSDGFNRRELISIKLKDGIGIAFMSRGNDDCRKNDNCAGFYIDLNGPKAPNRLGIDVHRFSFSSSSATLDSSNSTSTNSVLSCKYKGVGASTADHNGNTCKLWMLYKGNMDFLRRDVTDDWDF